jgi:hypothetical protein
MINVPIGRTFDAVLRDSADRERRARIVGDWLQTEARFLA